MLALYQRSALYPFGFLQISVSWGLSLGLIHLALTINKLTLNVIRLRLN